MGATPDLCICRDKPPAVLSAAWAARIKPVLAAGVDQGREIRFSRLQTSAKLMAGISEGLPEAFDARYRELSHHLPDCPLACPVDQTALALLA